MSLEIGSTLVVRSEYIFRVREGFEQNDPMSFCGIFHKKIESLPLEESGYEASEFVLWDAQHPTSKIDWVIYTFIAKGLKKVADMNLDAGEKIALKPVSFDEFIELGTSEKFAEKEIISKLYEAKLHPEKKVELKKLFNLKF